MSPRGPPRFLELWRKGAASFRKLIPINCYSAALMLLGRLFPEVPPINPTAALAFAEFLMTSFTEAFILTFMVSSLSEPKYSFPKKLSTTA